MRKLASSLECVKTSGNDQKIEYLPVPTATGAPAFGVSRSSILIGGDSPVNNGGLHYLNWNADGYIAGVSTR